MVDAGDESENPVDGDESDRTPDVSGEDDGTGDFEFEAVSGPVGPPADVVEEAPATDRPGEVPDDVTGIDHPSEDVLPDLLSYFETAPMPEFAPAPSPDALRENFFDFEYLSGDVVPVERYWLNEPYAYGTLLFDREEEDYRYRVSEPALDEFEAFLRSDLERMLEDVLLYEDPGKGDRRETLVRRGADIINNYARNVDPVSLYKVSTTSSATSSDSTASTR